MMDLVVNRSLMIINGFRKVENQETIHTESITIGGQPKKASPISVQMLVKRWQLLEIL